MTGQLRILLLATTMLIYGCLSQEITIFSSDQLTLLLASDSAKIWILAKRYVNGTQNDLLPCEMDDQLIFGHPESNQDTTNLQFRTGTIWCPGQTDSIIYQGFWKPLDSVNSQFLLWVNDGDTSFQKVDFISSQLLSLSRLEDHGEITEEFVAK